VFTHYKCFSFTALLVLAGCSTPEQVNWDRQIGKYTYDQAREDLSVPQHSQPEKDGSISAEWVTHRDAPGTVGMSHGNTASTPTFWNSPLPDTFHALPDHHLKLTFGPDHKLKSWQEFDR
jgi:hypothetical protein